MGNNNVDRYENSSRQSLKFYFSCNLIYSSWSMRSSIYR